MRYGNGIRVARKALLALCIGLTSFRCAAQSVQVVNFPTLQSLLAQPTDSVLVINFWATWCKPCVEELPLFDRLSIQYANQNVKVLLVSLDGVGKLEQRVRPFLTKKPVTSAKVLLLDSGTDNSWIDQVDANWSGSLPFTLLINPRQQRRKSFEQAFTWIELQSEVQKITN